MTHHLLVLLMALLIGVVAGLRSLTAPAVVAWAAALTWFNLDHTWASWMGSKITVAVLSLLAVAELVNDKLPKTPPRTAPPVFAARIIMGAFAGAVLGTVWGYKWGAPRCRHHRCGARHAGGLPGAKAAGSRDRRQGLTDRAARGCGRGLGWVRRGGGDGRRSVTAHFDAIIVGAGQAGPPLAGRLTAAGQRVAIVERKHVGGTCVNNGCIPTKTLVASAHAAQLARRGAEYGIGTGPVSVDMAKVKARKDKIMLDDRGGVESWLEGMDGCTLVRGHARFEDPHTLRVDDQLLRGDRIFLNVGGRAVVPDIPGLADIEFLTNVSILELDTVPSHLVIVGGSYIALEFAQMYRRFGAKVTVVERGPRLAAREDDDVSATIKEILEAEGIDVVLGAKDIRISRRDKDFELAPGAGSAPIEGAIC